MRVVSTRVLPEPAPARISAWLGGQRHGGELFGVEVFESERQNAPIIVRARCYSRRMFRSLISRPYLA